MTDRVSDAGVFDRVVCGIDGTPESLEAVRQVVALAPNDAKLHLFCAVNLAPALTVGWSAPTLADELQRQAGEALDEAGALAPAATRRLVSGRPVSSLLDELESEKATLVAVGTHGRSRAEGIALGSTAATMLHEAPCSVLVAREPELDGRAASIVVGLDGSAESEHAARAALDLGERLALPVKGVVALGGKAVQADVARSQLPDVEIDDTRSPVEVLVDTSRTSSLVVIGSRGLHGMRALGSVSERVGHQAACSVLVVRST